MTRTRSAIKAIRNHLLFILLFHRNSEGDKIAFVFCLPGVYSGDSEYNLYAGSSTFPPVTKLCCGGSVRRFFGYCLSITYIHGLRELAIEYFKQNRQSFSIFFAVVFSIILLITPGILALVNWTSFIPSHLIATTFTSVFPSLLVQRHRS